LRSPAYKGRAMSDESSPETIKALMLERVVAEFNRDWAEIARLAAKYPHLISLGDPTKAGLVADTSVVVATVTAGGTVATLAHHYRTDERSPYRKVQYATREMYEKLIDQIVAEFGSERLPNLKRDRIQQLYDGWKAGGHLVTAHQRATMLRQMVHFGDETMHDPACERLSVILHNMRFKVPKSQSVPMSAKQSEAFISKAHSMGLHSIALAQAFWFDCQLTQKDVIGEWVPLSEPGVSREPILGKTKWLRGLMWSAINEKRILRHTAFRTKAELEIDLNQTPQVKEELKRFTSLPSKGAIIRDKTDRPYLANNFRRQWHGIADAAGIPKNVKNMKSRKAGDNDDDDDDEDEDAPDAAQESAS
jgi:hypothetical protein